MSSRAFWLPLAVAAFAAGGSASAADAVGRDLVIDAPGDPIRVRVVTTVDGKPVEERRQALVEALAREADADADGELSEAELLSALVRAGVGFADQQRLMSGDATTVLAQALPPVEVVVQPQPLVDRLELFAALDADGDAFVTAEEFGNSERLFAKYDADGDGTLNQPELAPTEPLQPTPVRSGADFPPGRFPFRWEKPAGEPDVVLEIKLIGRAFGRPKVTLVEKAEGIAVTSETRKASFDVGGIGLDLDAATARVTSEDVKRFFLLQLRQRDADKNGYLTEEEFAGLGLPGLDYGSADENGDKMLFPDELAKRLDGLIARQTSRVRVEATFERQPLFTKLDSDGDGRLSRRELRNARVALMAADADSDGRIGLAEFGGRYRLSFGVPNLLDGANPRMVADFEAMTRGPSPRASDGPAWFAAMDRNADGDLARREFLGKAELFSELDADGDSLLSSEEAKAAEEKLAKSE